MKTISIDQAKNGYILKDYSGDFGREQVMVFITLESVIAEVTRMFKPTDYLYSDGSSVSSLQDLG